MGGSLKGFIVVFLSVYFVSNVSLAGAMITQVKGDGKLLRSKMRKAPSLMYEGKKYFYKPVKVGLKVRKGDLVLCGPNCKVRIINSNGNTFQVASSTSLKLPSLDGTEKAKVMDLLYGQVRAVVGSKDSKRTKLKVRTSAAVAGVRGTDFSVKHNATEGTEVQVLRGEVDIEAKNSKLPKMSPGSKESMTLKTGDKVIIPSSEKDLAQKKFEVETLHKGDVLALHQLSSYEKTAITDASLVKEINSYEQEAKTTLLNDIQKTQPQLYKKVSQISGNSMGEIEKEVIKNAFKAAQTSPYEIPEDIKKSLELYKEYIDQ